jgi:iron complex transport system substrate-binding protein
MRICSLLPSATETIAALGLEAQLVGRSAECDWPPSVRALPVVTSAQVDSSRLSSFEIDAAVRDALAEGRALYALDADLIEQLAPDLIVTQDLCAVCAVSAADVHRACAIGATVVSLDPGTLDEVIESFAELAEALDIRERGRELAAALSEQVAEVRAAVAGLPRRRVFVCEWLDPPFAAGHWVPEMVDAAGGVEVLGRAGSPSFPTTWDEVAAAEPELIVVAPCGFDAARAGAEAGALPVEARAVAVDANAYYSRPAPRLVDGIRQLAWLLHPERVDDPGLPAVELAP